MKDNKKIIGERINTLLAERNITQKELANYLDVKPNIISYFCSGARTPNIEQLIMISKYFNVPADYLLGLTNSQSNDSGIKAAVDVTGLTEDAVNDLISYNKTDIGKEYLELLSMLLVYGETKELLSLINSIVKYEVLKNNAKKDHTVEILLGNNVYVDIDGHKKRFKKTDLIEYSIQSTIRRSILEVCEIYSEELTPEKYQKLIEDFLTGGADNGKHKGEPK